jgi:hypothetical protein
MAPRWLGLLVVSIAVVAIPASAVAAPGDLIGQSCISKTGTGGCALLPQPSMLESAGGVVLAPDGTDVYVGAGAGIAHFRRAPDGTLTYANCVDVSSSIADRCPTATAPPDAGGALSANAINLAISPDGGHVYAVSWADALLWWARDPASGDLTWGGCRDAASDSATNGRCGTATTFAGGNFPAGSMAFSQGIAVTADGQTIYIADQTEGLLQAQRNLSTGLATPTACFNAAGSAAPGCTSTVSGVPMALSSIDVAPNSRDVYVRSISPGGITHFSRASGGATSFASCVAAVSPSAVCATAAPSPIFLNSGSLGVAGDLLFTHGGTNGTPSGTVARFARNADGSLAYESCASTEASPGPCAVLPAQTSGGGIGRLLVSSDASGVYLPQNGTAERALTRLTGSLAFASCLSDTGVAACLPAPLPAAFGLTTGQMALSPDGEQIYQAASDTLNVFEVEQAPDPGPPGGDPGAGAPPPAPPAVSPEPRRAATPIIRSVKRGKRGRYRVRVRVFQAGKLSARFTGRLKRKAKVRTLGKPVTKRVTKPGTYTISLKPFPGRRKREHKVKAKLIVSIAPTGYLPAQKIRAVGLR